MIAITKGDKKLFQSVTGITKWDVRFVYHIS